MSLHKNNEKLHDWINAFTKSNINLGININLGFDGFDRYMTCKDP